MHIKKIVILTLSNYNQRDRERFGVDIFRSSGFDVEVWDITGVLFPERRISYVPPDTITADNVQEFSKKGSLISGLAAIKQDTFVICLTNFDLQSLFIFEAMSRSSVNYAFNNCNIPPPGPAYSFLEKVLIKLKSGRRGFASSVSSAIVSSMKAQNLKAAKASSEIRPPRFLILGGRASDLKWPILKNTEKLWLHAFDYDRYLDVRVRPLDPEFQKIAVFLDHGTPFHPDHLTLSKRPPNPEIYYSSVRPFFELVEKNTGLEVVIAANPRLDIAGKEEYYGYRRIVSGRTPELVKQADLVIAHNSTSLSFASLFDKPVFFIGSAVHDARVIEASASSFGKRAHFNVQDKVDWTHELTVDQEAYANYRELYIKVPGTPEKPVWKMVAERIKSLDIAAV